MYLADSMRIVASGLDDTHKVLESEALRYHQLRCREVLEDHELFVFSRSALGVAADLRIDTPDRLENVARAVLKEPRRIFIEASYGERLRILSQLRGFASTNLPEGRHEPVRVGLSIDCAGNGRATISSFWCFRAGEIPAADRKRIAALARTRLERDAVREAARIGTTMCRIDVDLEAVSNVELAEFSRAVDQGEAWAMRFMHSVEATFSRGGSVDGRNIADMGRRGVIREAWRAYRLNALSRLGIDERAAGQVVEQAQATGQSPKDVLKDAEADLDGELIYAIAMLAALSAEGDGLRREDRPAVQSRAAKRGRPAVSTRDLEVDRLSVLTLDLSDRDLMRQLERVLEGKSEPHPRSGESASRVRHPVRGHLFRARNGEIVYRKPHWRGGRIAKVITRVV